MNILLILLGCNISYLLNNRIETAINFVSKFNDTNIDWFLSGGIKNPNEDIMTEAEKMVYKILEFEPKSNKWYYIYDTEATNTVENFIMVRKYLKQLEEYKLNITYNVDIDVDKYNMDYDDIYVVTSKFHYKRAQKIAEQILDIQPKWILGNAKLDDSDYWERIHMRNVEADILQAENKYFNY